VAHLPKPSMAGQVRDREETARRMDDSNSNKPNQEPLGGCNAHSCSSGNIYSNQ